MKQLGLITLITILASVSLSNTTLTTEFTPTEVYQGESITLTARVNGFAENMKLDFSAFPESTLEKIDQRDEQHHSVTVRGGRQYVDSFAGRVFRYRLTPSHAGTVHYGPIRLQQNGKLIASDEGASLTIRPIPQQDHVILKLETSPAEAVLYQPFDVNVRVLIRRLDGYPGLIASLPPSLTLPFIDTTHEGLESEGTQQKLNALLVSSGPAFRINHLSLGNDPFNGLTTRQRPALFRLPQQRTRYNNENYDEYRFSLRYTPIREGLYAFGPVVFNGTIATARGENGNRIEERVYAVSEAASIRVSQPPRATRPPSYHGTIGSNVHVRATLDTFTCYIGDPLTLTVEIKGDVRLDAIVAPRLDINEIERRHFRVYQDTLRRESTQDARRYHFTVRPTQVGTLEFPPLAMTYFDTLSKTYQTLHTDPLPVRVNAVTELRGDHVIRQEPGPFSLTGPRTTQMDATAPAPFIMSDQLADQHVFFSTRWHGLLFALGPLLYFLLELGKHAPCMVRKLTQAYQRQHAARSLLKTIAEHAEKTSLNTNEGLAMVKTYRHYLALSHSTRVYASTPSECRLLLKQDGMPDDLAERAAAALEEAMHLAYRSKDPREKAAAWIPCSRAIEHSVHALETFQKDRRKSSCRRRIPVIPLLLVIGLSMCGFRYTTSDHVTTLEESYELERSVHLMLTARSGDDFLETAQALANLIQQGSANAALFYNYGTALLLAGEHQQAWSAFIRAERYGGTTWSLRRNMRLARQESPSLRYGTWYRIPLIWHFGLAIHQRMTLTGISFLIFLIGCVHIRHQHKPQGLRIALIGALLFLLLGSSTLLSLRQERRASQQDRSSPHALIAQNRRHEHV